MFRCFPPVYRVATVVFALNWQSFEPTAVSSRRDDTRQTAKFSQLRKWRERGNSTGAEQLTWENVISRKGASSEMSRTDFNEPSNRVDFAPRLRSSCKLEIETPWIGVTGDAAEWAHEDAY